ncbi:TPA: hypothetical protein ACJJMW_000234, partial [Neisseria meningitidis]
KLSVCTADASNILQTVIYLSVSFRRFVGSEEPNYTPEDGGGQHFQRDFLGKFVISLSDKVFYFRQMLRRLQKSLPLLLWLVRLCEYAV